jgi:hypothetical protein
MSYGAGIPVVCGWSAVRLGELFSRVCGEDRGAQRAGQEFSSVHRILISLIGFEVDLEQAIDMAATVLTPSAPTAFGRISDLDL